MFASMGRLLIKLNEISHSLAAMMVMFVRVRAWPRVCAARR